MAISFWFMSSPNFLYLGGLWLSDLHACGAVRKIQDHWKPTMAIEIGVMVLALAVIVSGDKVAGPADMAFAGFTIYEGKFGWNPNLVWPQYMFFSQWYPALAILIWIELSHAMQWFMSWAIFVWLGKVCVLFPSPDCLEQH